MVGWNNRNRKNRAYTKWWNSLSEEEKEATMANEREVDKKLLRILATIVLFFVTIAVTMRITELLR